jgi:gamma-glutamylcyclotransferase (GGCT)/AIG2-like uncharacterized protein YtfP
MAAEQILFVYGTAMTGEPDHARLEGARPLGPAVTTPTYELIDLGDAPALVSGGLIAVTGELYGIEVVALAALDVHYGHPVLFKRTVVTLAPSGDADAITEAFAYLLDFEQTRGRRRIRTGDWRARRTTVQHEPGALVQWAKRRHR